MASLPQRVKNFVGFHAELAEFLVCHCSKRLASILVATNVSVTISAVIAHKRLTVPPPIHNFIGSPDGWFVTIGTFHISLVIILEQVFVLVDVADDFL